MTYNWCDYCAKDIDGGYAVAVGTVAAAYPDGARSKRLPIIRIACDDCKAEAEREIDENADVLLRREWYA